MEVVVPISSYLSSPYITVDCAGKQILDAKTNCKVPLQAVKYFSPHPVYHVNMFNVSVNVQDILRKYPNVTSLLQRDEAKFR